MSTNKTSDMTVGSPVKLIIRFMVPMCLGNIFQQFYNIADSIVAGQFIGVDALAAIGSTGSLMFFVTGWLNGLSSGFAILVSQWFGAKQYDDVRSSVRGICSSDDCGVFCRECADSAHDELFGQHHAGCQRLYGHYLCRAHRDSGI